MLTVSRTLANLVSMHNGQLVPSEPLYNIRHSFHCTAISKIHGDTSISKATHWPGPHSPNHNRLNTCISKDLYRYHTTASLVVTVWDCRYLDYFFFTIKINHREYIAVAKMIRSFCFQPTGVICWNSYSHLSTSIFELKNYT